MLDLFNNNNLETIFKRYLEYNDKSTGVFIVNNILTNDEVCDHVDKDLLKKQLSKFAVICKYKWKDFFEFNPSEITAMGDSFLGIRKGCKHGSNLKHIIYINPEVMDRISFVEIFLNKCEEKCVDFDFEYSLNPQALNGITIYATDDELATYKRIFSEIERDCPNIVARCGQTPFFSTKIDWYAYQAITDKTVFAVNLGFAKTLTDFYSNKEKFKMISDFGEKLYEVSATYQEKTNQLVGEYVRSRFIKYQSVIFEYLSQQNITFYDIKFNTPIKIPSKLVGNINLTVNTNDFVKTLRQNGVVLKDSVERYKFGQLLRKNTKTAVEKFGEESGVPKVLLNVEKTFDVWQSFHVQGSPKTI